MIPDPDLDPVGMLLMGIVTLILLWLGFWAAGAFA